MLYWNLGAVARYKQCWLLHADDHPVPQCADDRVIERLPAFFLEKLEHFRGRLAEGVGARPAGQALGDRVEKCHSSLGVAHQHGVGNAG